MAQKGFITDADEALWNLISNNLTNKSVSKSLLSSQDQISFSSPKDRQATRKLSIFLYHINRETTSRNATYMPDISQKNVNQRSFALHYLITPFTGNDKDDHALLEEITGAVLEKPVIAIRGKESDVDCLAELDSLSLDELTKLWIALGLPLKLSISLKITIFEGSNDSTVLAMSVNTPPQSQAIDKTNVTQLYQAVLKTFTEQSTGWMNKNMFIKQWVLQEFKKNTDMTVEEMTISLNHLGDKLEQHQSTTQFIEPLNLLAGYYQHQLDELKGLQKLSHKQTENLETLTTWIKEIKSLVDALSN